MQDDVWPFVPEVGFIDTYQFLSDVLRTYSSEQRIKLRRQPRRSMYYRHLLNQDQYAQAKMKARRYGQTGTMYVPLWSEQKYFESVSSGTTSIDFSDDGYTLYYQYNASDKVILWVDWDNYVVRDISSMDETTITLSSSVGTDLSNVFVMPLRAAVAYQGFDSQESSYNNTYMGATFTLKESSDAYGWINYDLFLVSDIFDLTDIFERVVENYNGIYVRKEAPYRLGTVDDFILEPIQIVDSGFGPIETEELFNYINNIQTVEFFFQDKATRATEIRDFFGGLRGKVVSFYLPTFNNDLPLIPGTYNSTTLSVEDHGLTTDYNNRAIMIEETDGTKSYNTINSSVQATSQIDLTLDTAVNFNSSDIQKISFMNLVRCDVDEFVITNGHAGSGSVRFNVIEVPV